MSKILVYVFLGLLSLSLPSYAQTESRSELIKDHKQKLHQHTDSIISLKNDTYLIYTSDSLSKGTFIKFADSTVFEVDRRSLEYYSGFIELGIDFDNYVLLKEASSGSGNPVLLKVINKITKEQTQPGRYPIYTDSENEIILFEDDQEQLVIYDFKSGTSEVHQAPPRLCACCGCYKVIEFTNDHFTIRYGFEPGEELDKRYTRKNH